MRVWIVLCLCNLTALAQSEKPVPPVDPWRIVDGQTNCICGPGWRDYFYGGKAAALGMVNRKEIYTRGWYGFWGTVIEVQPTGIRMHGGTMLLPGVDAVFFIEHYPYSVADDSYISWQVAKDAGLYTYMTVLGASATIHKFDYGTICEAPAASVPSEADEAQARAQSAAKKKTSQEKALKYWRDLAATGDAGAEWRLGEIYRDGEGVSKDLTQARVWLQKAANQGQKEASAELANLPSPK